MMAWSRPLAAALALGWSAPVLAEEPPPPDEAEAPPASEEPPARAVAPRAWGPAALGTPASRGSVEALTDDRVPPDHDGRDVPDPPAEAALWPARVVLFPLYLVERYVVYPPVSTVAIWQEKHKIPARVADALTFGDSYSMTLVPTALFEFGFRPSVGLMLLSRGLPAADVKMRTQVAWGGPEWTLVTTRARVPLTEAARESTLPLGGSEFSASFLYGQRPDYVFHGIGSDATRERHRYTRQQLGGTLGTEIVLGELDGITLSAGVNRNRFGAGQPVDEDPLIAETFDVEDPKVVPGFGGYTLGSAGAELVLDSRRTKPEPGTGVRLHLAGDYGSDLAGDLGAFVHYGGDLSAFVDLTGGNRNLGIRQSAFAVHALDDAVVPFTELVELGGGDMLRGFHAGRYRGGSALVTSLQYTWPVWVYLDGILYAEAGGVFGEDFEGVSLGDMAGSFGLGLRSNIDRDASFHAMLGLGTTRFDEPAFEIDTVRMVLGVARGF